MHEICLSAFGVVGVMRARFPVPADDVSLPPAQEFLVSRPDRPVAAVLPVATGNTVVMPQG